MFVAAFTISQKNRTMGCWTLHCDPAMLAATTITFTHSPRTHDTDAANEPMERRAPSGCAPFEYIIWKHNRKLHCSAGANASSPMYFSWVNAAVTPSSPHSGRSIRFYAFRVHTFVPIISRSLNYSYASALYFIRQRFVRRRCQRLAWCMASFLSRRLDMEQNHNLYGTDIILLKWRFKAHKYIRSSFQIKYDE